MEDKVHISSSRESEPTSQVTVLTTELLTKRRTGGASMLVDVGPNLLCML